jgi:hypothetical protein
MPRPGIFRNVRSLQPVLHLLEEKTMRIFMVERDLNGITMEALGAAQRAAISKGQQMSEGGTPIRYIRSTFAPGDGRCMCLFEAEQPEDVRRLNEEAGIPYFRVVEAFDLTP